MCSMTHQWDGCKAGRSLFCNDQLSSAGHLYAIEEISAIRIFYSIQQPADDSGLV
jgi:hypothetical protein